MTAEPEPALVPHEVVTRLTAIWSTSPWAASAAIYAALAQLALGWRDRASLVAAGPGGEERLVAPELGAWAGTRELAALAADAADVVDELCADGGPIELRAEAGGRLPPECPALTVALSPAGLSFRSGEAGAQTAHAVAAAARQCADGRRTAAEVDWLTPEQRARVEDSLTGRSVDGEFVPVHELFERTADRRPDAIALAFEDQAITYAELEDGANRLAHHLRSLGAGPERLVGVCHDRGPQLVRSLLAVLKTGAAYVPLDPHFPAERLQAILEEAQPSVVLCDDDRVHVLGKRAPAVVVPGRDEGSIRARPSGRLARVTTPDDAMYVIYTSGSTGRPKGIVQVHRAISNLVAWQTHSSGIDHEGPVLQFSSLGFDVHLQELFPTFARGGTVCLTRRENLLDPRRLAGVLARHSVRTVFLSVSTLTRLFDSGRELSSLPATLTDVVTAGEQLHVGHSLAAFLAARPALRLHNHYGVSESHVVTARWVAGGGRVEPRAPIGRPIWNCRLRLLSPDLRAVPPGAVGEVWIAGDCLARHYLGREEETAAYFQQLDGERWYKTRDLARLLPSGELEFMGRIDDQLKVRGHLVEPGEVEAAMRALPGIEECAVGPVAEASGGTALAAWYTGPGPLAVDRLRSALAGRLPDFMVPAHFVHVAT
ncbi:MAG TPA: amino acid adenylation domain-containing protein, partial [Candidatus Dormibacteraeota bacterium]|nr:amino acid adenylation domain-containing protein [Candidatus Dormibacteraeota bacterium]